MPILNADSVEFISRSTAQTRRVGMRLGGLLRTSDLVCLVGDLGSGKTTFVQGVASGWGSLDQAASPSYVIVNMYRGLHSSRLYHLDAYRLISVDDAVMLDIDEMLASGPLVVEWADQIEDALPKEGLWIHLRMIDEEQRDMLLSARGKRYHELLSVIRRRVFGVA